MSQEARMRAVIDAAVAEATRPLEERLDALEARVAAVQDGGGAPDATEPKRPSTGRTAKARAATSSKAGTDESTTAGTDESTTAGQ
ncbi:hypothetical protein ACH4F6_37865 [Streptomyces sp. NPDC017936]|uniref:hypothetical protein n=1 Tax=Streptomyces sp. NPDC017936 TaxID=3365016 RepID=UPI0037BD1020